MNFGLTVVTGAAGFLGNAIARKLHDDGFDVLGLDDFSSGTVGEIAPGLRVLPCDLRSRRALESAMPEEVEAVVHCAAQSSGEISFDDPWDDMTRHLHATMNLLEISVARHVRHFIYTSSMAAYGISRRMPVHESEKLEPISFYGAGKAATENYVRIYAQSGMGFTIIRPFSIYGPGQNLANLRQGMVSIYLAQLLQTGCIEVKGSLDRFRDFVHIDDAVQAYVSLLGLEGGSGDVLNLCSGQPTTVREILNCMLKEAGSDWSAVRVIDGTPGDQFGIYGDNSRLRDLVGWAPAWDFRKGIADLWARNLDSTTEARYV